MNLDFTMRHDLTVSPRATYAQIHEWGVRKGVSVSFTLDLPILRGLGILYGNLAALPLPCHDPPVAWRVENGLWGFAAELPLIACPALLHPAVVPARNMPLDLPVLDSEPGRRP